MLSLTAIFPFGLLTSVGTLLASFVIYYVAWIIYSRFFHPYHDIPGPFLASITQWWYFRTIRHGIADNSQLPLHKKYGKFVRIAPNEVSISDPNAVDVIYGTSPQFAKTEWYDSFNPHIGDRVEVFSARDPKLHADARRKIAHLFTPGAVSEYEPCVDHIVDVFSTCMTGFASTGEVIDISTYFRKYSFDVIGEMYYGKEGGFGFLRDNVDYNGWMGMIDILVPPLSSLGYIPKGMQTLYLMTQLLSSETRQGLKASETVIQQAKAVVKERQEEIESGERVAKRDGLSRLMDIVHDRGEKIDFNMDDVAVNVWDFIMAGSDSTGYALTGIFYHVLKHPRVYKKLQHEIDAANLPTPIRYKDAVKLPYLNACIKEGCACRLRRAQGSHGKYFPGGYKVIMNPNTVHFDKDCFGEDAEQFVPERWLQEDQKKVANMGRHEIGFGSGPRLCLGKNISLIEMYKLIPAIMQQFEFKLVESEWKVKNCWFRCPSNVMVKVSKR